MAPLDVCKSIFCRPMHLQCDQYPVRSSCIQDPIKISYVLKAEYPASQTVTDYKPIEDESRWEVCNIGTSYSEVVFSRSKRMDCCVLVFGTFMEHIARALFLLAKA